MISELYRVLIHTRKGNNRNYYLNDQTDINRMYFRRMYKYDGLNKDVHSLRSNYQLVVI